MTPQPDPLRALVDEQAEDEGLWFIAQTAPEAYLQQELRRLHAAIEGQPVQDELGPDWIDDNLGHQLDSWLVPGSVDPTGHNAGPDGEPEGDCYKCRRIRDFIREYARDAAALRATPAHLGAADGEEEAIAAALPPGDPNRTGIL